MAAQGKWFVTPHAVQRYRERLAPHLTYEEARNNLIEQSRNAHYVKTFTFGNRSGYELWRVGRKENGMPQLITVMGGHDRGWR